ncbi:hypothetical protein [Gymnodinialimonas ulvae]|uniref:hypothetical protein n=1 Tax=Gymnodinialimonas ulvae TaxID=3126504 RepID=UPI0030EE23E6
MLKFVCRLCRISPIILLLGCNSSDPQIVFGLNIEGTSIEQFISTFDHELETHIVLEWLPGNTSSLDRLEEQLAQSIVDPCLLASEASLVLRWQDVPGEYSFAEFRQLESQDGIARCQSGDMSEFISARSADWYRERIEPNRVVSPIIEQYVGPGSSTAGDYRMSANFSRPGVLHSIEVFRSVPVTSYVGQQIQRLFQNPNPDRRTEPVLTLYVSGNVGLLYD